MPLGQTLLMWFGTAPASSCDCIADMVALLSATGSGGGGGELGWGVLDGGEGAGQW